MDERIRVIHQQNGGLSRARNAAMELAKGAYIGFVDSDDYIHPQMYELLLAAMKQENAELAICREVAFEDGKVLSEEVAYRIETRTLETDDRKSFCRKFIAEFTGPVTWTWNKLYKRECIEKLRFAEGKRMEDIRFVSDAALCIERVVWVPERLYYYRQRGGSIMNSGNPAIFTEHGEALMYSYQTLKGLQNAGFQADYRRYILNNLANLEAEAYHQHYKKECKQLRTIFLELYHEKGQKGILPLKLYLARYCSWLYYLLKR